jgi:RNA polymerase sigma factor for flagellar operon FliA
MDEAARDKLARDHMAMVQRITLMEMKRLTLNSHIEMEEVRSFAMEGLASAIDRFDPDRNTSFATYADRRIRGAIYDGLCQSGWFPRRLKRRINFYRRSEEMLRSYSDTPPPKDKVEAVHRLADTLKELASAYVTTYVAESGQEPVSSQEDADIIVERKQYGARLRRCIDMLPPKQRQVVHCYFFEEQRLGEIAERMQISVSWASKLMSAGLSRMRKSFVEHKGVLNPQSDR